MPTRGAFGLGAAVASYRSGAAAGEMDNPLATRMRIRGELARSRGRRAQRGAWGGLPRYGRASGHGSGRRIDAADAVPAGVGSSATGCRMDGRRDPGGRNRSDGVWCMCALDLGLVSVARGKCAHGDRRQNSRKRSRAISLSGAAPSNASKRSRRRGASWLMTRTKPCRTPSPAAGNIGACRARSSARMQCIRGIPPQARQGIRARDRRRWRIGSQQAYVVPCRCFAST